MTTKRRCRKYGVRKTRQTKLGLKLCRKSRKRKTRRKRKRNNRKKKKFKMDIDIDDDDDENDDENGQQENFNTDSFYRYIDDDVQKPYIAFLGYPYTNQHDISINKGELFETGSELIHFEFEFTVPSGRNIDYNNSWQTFHNIGHHINAYRGYIIDEDDINIIRIWVYYKNIDKIKSKLPGNLKHLVTPYKTGLTTPNYWIIP